MKLGGRGMLSGSYISSKRRGMVRGSCGARYAVYMKNGLSSGSASSASNVVCVSSSLECTPGWNLSQ